MVAVRRARVAKPAPGGWLAWRCVVLAVDTALHSGWAIRVRGRLRESGEVDTKDDCEMGAIVRRACAYVEHTNAHACVLVLERPWGGRGAMLMALGAARDRWLRAWGAAQCPASHVVTVYPATWRARVLGGGAHRMEREQVRALEMQAASHECGFTCNALDMQTVAVGPDEAAAILISKWAANARPVGDVLPKRVRALSEPVRAR